jgi:hypothetical protein
VGFAVVRLREVLEVMIHQDPGRQYILQANPIFCDDGRRFFSAALVVVKFAAHGHSNGFDAKGFFDIGAGAEQLGLLDTGGL